MTRLSILLTAALFAVSCSTATAPATPPDLILAGGRIFTADDAKPWAEAIAIRGERIAAVGPSDELRKLAGPETRVVELEGRLVVPGINDAHVHAPWTSPGETIDVADDATVEQLLAAVGSAAKERPEGTLLLADIPIALTDAAGLTRSALDAVAPRHPVHLAVLGGHAVLLNSAALRDWRIAEDAANPRGGRYGREGGFLSGWIYEHPLWINASADMGRMSDEAIVNALRRFAEPPLKRGVTSFQSMPPLPLDRVQRLLPSANIPQRWRWIDFRMMSIAERPVRPTKYILDGTPIERGAALREPYADRQGERGVVNYTDDEIRAMVEAAARTDQQLLLHIAGEVPFEKLFAAMKAVPADWPSKRVRIEHGDFIGRYLEDAKALGVVLVQNPSHLMLPQVLPQRLGRERLASYQAMRLVLERGIPFALGSDGPTNPWLNVMFATMHPLNPNEAITREQAVIAYTRGAAYAERTEHEKGTLTAGKLADLAVLSQDVFAVPQPDVPKTRSVMTIIGGKIVWSELP